MNKTLSTVLKILGALAALAAVVGTVLYFLEKKGIITCCSGDCLNCEESEACELAEEAAVAEEPAASVQDEAASDAE